MYSRDTGRGNRREAGGGERSARPPTSTSSARGVPGAHAAPEAGALCAETVSVSVSKICTFRARPSALAGPAARATAPPPLPFPLPLALLYAHCSETSCLPRRARPLPTVPHTRPPTVTLPTPRRARPSARGQRLWSRSRWGGAGRGGAGRGEKRKDASCGIKGGGARARAGLGGA